VWAVSDSGEEEDATWLTGPGTEGKGKPCGPGNTLPVPRF